ncbi:MAG: tetratricopeptide repeat protein [Deltaproteobacteria bacterium]|nr:MAG: tetratricopeptide repeat protein [Deltaproteobacteria bacterium]
MVSSADRAGSEGSGSGAAAHLRAELERLATANPFEVLGVGYDAGSEQVRAAFLALTKRYHPSRFARGERDTVRAANELFLRIKDAYTRLSDDARRAQMRELFAPAAAPASCASAGAPETPPRAPAARPAPAAPATARRAASPPESKTPPATGTRAAAGTRPVAATTARRPAPAAPATAQRTGSARRSAPGAGSTRRPVAGTPPPARAAAAIAAGLQDTVRRRAEAYEQALAQLAAGRYADARRALHRIAAEEPQTKKYRVQMHYAWGLEHEEAGRIEEARREFERALALDPEYKRAHEALDRLPPDKKGGLFKKFFGR